MDVRRRAQVHFRCVVVPLPRVASFLLPSHALNHVTPCEFHTKLDSDIAASWTGISREDGLNPPRFSEAVLLESRADGGISEFRIISGFLSRQVECLRWGRAADDC